MGTEPSTEEQRRLLAASATRATLDVLDDAGGPLAVEQLAARLVKRDAAVVRSSAYEERLGRTVLSLHHEHLPKLADAGLVEYDTGTNAVTPRRSPASILEWERASDVDDLVGHLSTADDTDLGVIEGRESVLEFGRRLADRAEEELFCIYVTTDLLEPECIRRARKALERGVQVYVGSESADVRDRTRRNLPDATVWEPQLDWTNAPSYPRVGRLVLADRRAVMLAVLEKSTTGTSPEETAVTGSGDDHPLVVLVRELLGPRLDHLDHQSEHFLADLR